MKFLFIALTLLNYSFQDNKALIAGTVGTTNKTIKAIERGNQKAVKNYKKLDNARIEDYATSKVKAISLRKALKEKFETGELSLNKVGEQFADFLTEDIIPYWYGTPWSFGGHTEEPNRGEVACGYFISTTLRDMGVNLNRYKLAQKAPIDEAKTLSCGDRIITVTSQNSEQAYQIIEDTVTNGLYFLGFDAGHVAYLVKKEEGLFLIHSNYLHPAAVQIEPLKESRVFQSFDVFHLTKISGNALLIKRWLYQDEVY